MFDAHAVVGSFLEVAQLATLPIDPAELRVEFSAAPHLKPKSLPKAEQAVYAFFLGDTCLKVGKAGPKNNPRFCVQHYKLRAPSTLAKSLLANRRRLADLAPDHSGEIMALSEENVGAWIRANTGRANFYLPCSSGPFALALLEAFIQCRFKPIFEGSTA